MMAMTKMYINHNNQIVRTGKRIFKEIWILQKKEEEETKFN